MTVPMLICLDVNGEHVEAQVLPRLNLADFLREPERMSVASTGFAARARCVSMARSFALA